jgi:hypothetical protein
VRREVSRREQTLDGHSAHPECMPLPRPSRPVLALVAMALMLGTVSRTAWSQKVSDYATDIVRELVAGVTALATSPQEPVPTAVASHGPTMNSLGFDFAPFADAPEAYREFASLELPNSSLAYPVVMDIEATNTSGRLSLASLAATQGLGAGGHRSGEPRGSGFGSSPLAGTASGLAPVEGDARSSHAETTAGPGAAPAQKEEVSGSSGAALMASPLVASLLSELDSARAFGELDDVDEELTGLHQFDAGHRTGLEGWGDDSLSLEDPTVPGALPKVPVLDSLTEGAGLDGPALAQPGWGPSLVADSSNLAMSVAIISEPATLAILGIGLVAVASRMRSTRRQTCRSDHR